MAFLKGLAEGLDYGSRMGLRRRAYQASQTQAPAPVEERAPDETGPAYVGVDPIDEPTPLQPVQGYANGGLVRREPLRLANGGFWGGMASGLTTGAQVGSLVRSRNDENRRADEEFALKKRQLTGQVEDAERQRADEEAARIAGQRAIAEAMSAGQPVPSAAVATPAAAPAAAPSDPGAVTPAGASDPAAPGVAVATPSSAPGAPPAMGAMPAAPAAAPAAPPAGPGMANAAPRTPHPDAILQGLDARWQTLLERGNQTKALESFNQASQLRAQLRDKAMDRADSEYELTGDPNAYLQPYNKYVLDGGNAKSVTRKPDGSFSIEGDFGGQPFEKSMSAQDFKKLTLTMRDQSAMRKHELAIAQKTAEEAAKVHIIPDGGTAATGAAIVKAGGNITNPKDTKGKDNYITIKGPKDQGDRVMQITPGGLVDATPGADGGLPRGTKFTGKENLPVHKEIMDIAEKEFGQYDPVTGKYVLKGPDLQKALSRASVATQVFEGAEQGGAQMDHATAYRIAQEGQTQPDAVFKTPDGRYMTQPAVKYNNQVYPLGGSKPTDVTDRVLAAQKKGVAPAAAGLKRDGQGSPAPLTQPAPKTTAGAPATPAATPAKPGTAAQIVTKGGVTELARRVEAMYPPTEVRSGRSGSVRSMQDSPEVARLKGMSGPEMLKYADELLGATQTADRGLTRGTD